MTWPVNAILLYPTKFDILNSGCFELDAQDRDLLRGANRADAADQAYHLSVCRVAILREDIMEESLCSGTHVPVDWCKNAKGPTEEAGRIWGWEVAVCGPLAPTPDDIWQHSEFLAGAWG